MSRRGEAVGGCVIVAVACGCIKAAPDCGCIKAAPDCGCMKAAPRRWLHLPIEV
ncbi:MAG: hypothetical protein K2H35_00120 [Muribaculaceae bacterium]|nr:hypothetical protein [Muribaculaceae bacterium]